MPQVSTPAPSFWTGRPGPGCCWFLCGGGSDFGQRLSRAALWLCCINWVCSGAVRADAGGGAPPPGTVWPGRLGLEKEGSAPAPRPSCRPWACAPGERRPRAECLGSTACLATSLPPRGGPRALESAAVELPQQRRPGEMAQRSTCCPQKGPAPQHQERPAGETAVEV